MRDPFAIVLSSDGDEMAGLFWTGGNADTAGYAAFFIDFRIPFFIDRTRARWASVNTVMILFTERHICFALVALKTCGAVGKPLRSLNDELLAWPFGFLPEHLGKVLCLLCAANASLGAKAFLVLVELIHCAGIALAVLARGDIDAFVGESRKDVATVGLIDIGVHRQDRFALRQAL